MSLWKCFWQNCFWPLLLLILLGLVQMFWPGGEWRTIENDVHSTITEELQVGGFDWAKVETHDRGRDVLLSGTAPSEEAKSQAMTVASQLAQDDHGNPVARIVEWQGEVAAPAPEPIVEVAPAVEVAPEPQPGNLSFSAVNGNITLNGVVSSDEQKQSLLDAANATYGASNVVDRLTVKENIIRIDNIENLVDDFALSDGTLRLTLDKVLKINGEVNTEDRKASIGQSLEASLSDAYSLDNQLTVAVPDAANLSMISAGGKVTVNGNVASEAQKQAIIDSANNSFGASNVVDNLVVGENTLPIENVRDLAGRFSLSDGSMSLSNGVLTLTGEVDSETIKSDMGQQVQSTLSAGYTLDNQLSIKAPDLSAICQEKVRSLMSDSKIFFATSKADIKAESYPLLDQIGLILNDCQESSIEVAGHTDSTGSAEINQPLSLSRAQAVVEYLIAKGVNASRLSSAGFGSEQPVADNATNEGRAANRRIEFTVK